MGEGSAVALSRGVGHRRGLNLALLWLWRRPAATAPIRTLAWEPLYALGAALEKAKISKGKKKKEQHSDFSISLQWDAQS